MNSSSSNTAAAEELVGHRFKPTEQELVSHYLKKKMQGKDSHFPVIYCCNHEPWDLLALLVPTKDMEWFFFSPRDYKSAKSKRFNRATVQGYWKKTGKSFVIKARHSEAVIGNKSILTFYEGRAPNSSKTNYIMHEYDLADSELETMPRQNGDFVLCRLKIKPDKSHKKKGSSVFDKADPDSYIAPNFENQAAADDMIVEQEENLAFKELRDLLFPNGNVGECKESQKDSCLIDENDISTCGESAFSDFEMQEAFAKLESLLHLTQPEEQHLGNVPLADVNNGECSWGKSPLGDNDSCLTNKNNISTNDNHEPVSNAASNFGSATDDSTPEVFTQPGEDLEPLDYSFLKDYLLLSPMHTEPRDVFPGNNYIAGNELQSPCGDYDFSLTDYYPYPQTTPSSSIDSNLPESLGTQSTFNYSFQGQGNCGALYCC